jgi:hypothetical protein
MSDENDCCTGCGQVTVFQDTDGDPMCMRCFDNRQEAAYERSLAKNLAGGGGGTPTGPIEVMAQAYARKRRDRA